MYVGILMLWRPASQPPSRAKLKEHAGKALGLVNQANLAGCGRFAGRYFREVPGIIRS